MLINKKQEELLNQIRERAFAVVDAVDNYLPYSEEFTELVEQIAVDIPELQGLLEQAWSSID